eukprot:gb/GFBE01049031.1/.p1 GENE.gb/GFBE01049031.1/~~gb/GFBE01049031.1/.p1  ORF type:complete len:113 (+),score=27.79 gb/GFBE01049031.1/:1-339(+)
MAPMKALLATLAFFAAPSAAVKTARSHVALAADTNSTVSPCDQQCRFDIMMCKSFMCTECTYEWCTSACQKIQADFPSNRCADWPESRTSYSNGDFKGKGALGDGGEYAETR